MGNFIDVTVSDMKDGIWTDKVSYEWQNGNIALPKLLPEPTGQADLREAIETIIDSNGSFDKGDSVGIHSSPTAFEMSSETAIILEERGISTDILIGFREAGKELYDIMTDTFGKDISNVNIAALDGLVKSYRTTLERITKEDSGHWILPLSNAPKISDKYSYSSKLYEDVIHKGTSDVGRLREAGIVKSHDLWTNPTRMDVDLLNKSLSKELHWTFQEWKNFIFKAMSVSSDEFERIAMDMEEVQLTIEASLHGGTLVYEREDGTYLEYKVEGRPIILGKGLVGNNSIGGTKKFFKRLTNQPNTEVFVAPIENSGEGVLVYTVPEQTTVGMIDAPYIINVKNGKAVSVSAPNTRSENILKHYTGLGENEMTGDEKKAFSLRKSLAEVAISGFNPVIESYVLSGRLIPVLGFPMIEEKMGDHAAFGSNDFFKGKIPGAVGEYNVGHTDFIGGIDRKVRLK